MLYRHVEEYRSGDAFAARVTAFAIRLGARLRSWKEGRDAIWHLRRLDDHLLADLGLEREDIARRVKGRR